MKTLVKAIAIASLASTAAVAQAEVSVDAGMATSYQFRGVELDAGAIAGASVGYSSNGFSAGIAVTSGDFTETDYSLAYTANVGGLDLTLGYTLYTYDQDGSTLDDEEQKEISLSTNVGGLGITYVDGSGDNADGTEADDYDVIVLDYSVGNVGLSIGMVGSDANDADYNYFEISNSTDVAGITLSATYTGTFSEDDNATNVVTGNDLSDDTNRIVFAASKAFDL